jgi:YVTN family beta-propeller protein
VRGVLRGYVTPRNIVFAPDGKSFYVSDSSLGTVTRLDTTTLKPLATASTLAAGPGAFGTALSKDGSALYVNNQASSTVTRLDTASGQAKAVITGFAQPRQGVRLSPDGAKLYVTNFLGDKVTIVDTQTDKIEGEITGFNKIRAISVTADGKTLFAANSGSNDIAVVDIAARPRHRHRAGGPRPLRRRAHARRPLRLLGQLGRQHGVGDRRGHVEGGRHHRRLQAAAPGHRVHARRQDGLRAERGPEHLQGRACRAANRRHGGRCAGGGGVLKTGNCQRTGAPHDRAGGLPLPVRPVVLPPAQRIE